MEQPLFRQFIRYVTAGILGTLGLSCYILADTFFIAQAEGALGIAALNLSIPIYTLIQGIGLLLGIGGATRFSLLLAGGKQQQALTVLSTSAKAGLAVSLGFLLAALWWSGPIAHLLGADFQTFALTRVYLQTIFFFAPFFLLNQILLAFVRNDGRPDLAMSAMLTGSIANIILDYLFLFPLGMGMFGAALATGLAPIISLSVLARHFASDRTRLLAFRARAAWRKVPDLCRLGSSALIIEWSAGVVLVVFNFVILSLEGNEGIAAYGIVANLALVAIAIFTGLAQGMQPLASRYAGLNKMAQAQKLLGYTLLTSLVLACLFFGVAAGFHKELVALFNTDGSARIAGLAENGLLLYCFSFFFAGPTIAAVLYFSATEQAEQAFFLSLARGLVLIVPLVLLMSRRWGMDGVWGSVVATEAAALILALGLARRRPKCAATLLSVPDDRVGELHSPGLELPVKEYNRDCNNS